MFISALQKVTSPNIYLLFVNKHAIRLLKYVYRTCQEIYACFYCFRRKKQKHKDKKRKGADDDDKPDIVGKCILIFIDIDKHFILVSICEKLIVIIYPVPDLPYVANKVESGNINWNMASQQKEALFFCF